MDDKNSANDAVGIARTAVAAKIRNGKSQVAVTTESVGDNKTPNT